MLYQVKKAYSFNELNEKLQEKVIEDHVGFMLEVDDNDDRVQYAVNEADRLQTPWFQGQILWDNYSQSILNEVKEYYYDEYGNIIRTDELYELNL